MKRRGPPVFLGTRGSAVVRVRAEASTGATRPFEMMAYGGGSMRLPGFPLPVVVDLPGLHLPGKAFPILRQHDPDRVIGHGLSAVVKAHTLRVRGVLVKTLKAAKEVIALAETGFPWAASIGAEVVKMEHVREGKVMVNARALEGPLLVARKSKLKEVSFVVIGADEDATASVA
jgi:hypothetical protein